MYVLSVEERMYLLGMWIQIIIIYISLITHGSEMRNQERMEFLFFVLIGKKKKRNFHPSPRGSVRGWFCPSIHFPYVNGWMENQQ